LPKTYCGGQEVKVIAKTVIAPKGYRGKWTDLTELLEYVSEFILVIKVDSRKTGRY